MNTVPSRPTEVEMDFTVAPHTGFGSRSVQDRLDLSRALRAVSDKLRARGASDMVTLWSLIASLAAGTDTKVSDGTSCRAHFCCAGFGVRRCAYAG